MGKSGWLNRIEPARFVATTKHSGNSRKSHNRRWSKETAFDDGAAFRAAKSASMLMPPIVPSVAVFAP